MLTSRITPHDATNDPEDIFSSALTTIFPDDTINSHGTPGSSVTYHSPRFGDIRLQIPQYPDVEEGRKLFAHHLWNAGVVVAEAIESASCAAPAGLTSKDGARDDGEARQVVWDKRHFDVRGKTVVELGAGTALPSLISALSAASTVTITDHPSSPALTTNTIMSNIQANIPTNPANPPIQTCGYVWGTTTFYTPNRYGKPLPSSTSACVAPTFDKIIIADCLWMPSQHINLIRTILNFFPPDPPSSHPPTSSTTTSSNNNNPSTAPTPTPCALVVAGFHTGRDIVTNFFSLATEPPDASVARPVDPPWKPHGAKDALREEDKVAPTAEATGSGEDGELSEEDIRYVGKLKLAEIFEVDVDLNKRPWLPTREGETKWEAKRWCVVGVLVRR